MPAAVENTGRNIRPQLLKHTSFQEHFLPFPNLPRPQRFFPWVPVWVPCLELPLSWESSPGWSLGTCLTLSSISSELCGVWVCIHLVYLAQRRHSKKSSLEALRHLRKYFPYLHLTNSYMHSLYLHSSFYIKIFFPKYQFLKMINLVIGEKTEAEKG